MSTGPREAVASSSQLTLPVIIVPHPNPPSHSISSCESHSQAIKITVWAPLAKPPTGFSVPFVNFVIPGIHVDDDEFASFSLEVDQWLDSLSINSFAFIRDCPHCFPIDLHDVPLSLNPELHCCAGVGKCFSS